MLIGDVARRAGVNVQTVRFYERRGLLAVPARTTGGYRTYTEDAHHRIQFIKRAQELGFSLAEIGELLDLQVDDDASCHIVEERTQGKIDLVEAKITELRAMKKTLQRLVQSCRSRQRTGECPVLEMLDAEPGE